MDHVMGDVVYVNRMIIVAKVVVKVMDHAVRGLSDVVTVIYDGVKGSSDAMTVMYDGEKRLNNVGTEMDDVVKVMCELAKMMMDDAVMMMAMNKKTAKTAMCIAASKVNGVVMTGVREHNVNLS